MYKTLGLVPSKESILRSNKTHNMTFLLRPPFVSLELRLKVTLPISVPMSYSTTYHFFLLCFLL